MSGSRTNACAMFTPNGLLVSERIFFTSSRIASSSPEEVSMMPSPPALETAEASCDRAIQPIGACTTGISTPSSRVTRLSNTGLAMRAAYPRTGFRLRRGGFGELRR